MVELNRELIINTFGHKSDFTNLTHLSYRNINKIDSNAFQEFTKLEYISLYCNEIEELEGALLKSLSKLEVLRFYDSRLKQIESNTFKGLTQLLSLDLSKNELTTINANCFIHLSNLYRLRLYRNKLKQIESNAFNGLVNLESLYLYSNQIEEFNKGTFNGLSNLKELYLELNKLERIDSNTFIGLTKLETLRLGHNQIEEIYEGSFNGLSNLKELYLENNHLKRIDTNTFENLTKLETLRLDHNEIEEINKGAFNGLSNLKELYLEHNKLKRIERRSFDHLKSIKSIQLNGAKFKVFSYLSDSDTIYFNKFVSTLNEFGFLTDWNCFLDQFQTPFKDFYNPKLLIIDYYYSLINDIDIYTEELLEKYSEDDLLQIESKPESKDSVKIEGFKNPYKIESKNKSMINVTQGSTKVHEYLALVRSKAIEEINKVKEENLERYETNKDKYKYDRNELTDGKLEEIKSELFKEKFCFLLRIDNKNSTNNEFNLITIVSDFYLDEFDRNLIKSLSQCYLKFLYKDFLVLNSILDYIICESSNCTNKVISISKEALGKIEAIRMEYNVSCFNKDDLDSAFQFVDFSRIKSIDISFQTDTIKIENLSKIFENLEYLSICGGYVGENSTFIGLDKLIKLELKKCYSFRNDNIDYKLFSPLTNLRFLIINYSSLFCCRNIRRDDLFENLNSLKYLEVKKIK